jgi:hypothetical protein
MPSRKTKQTTKTEQVVEAVASQVTEPVTVVAEEQTVVVVPVVQQTAPVVVAEEQTVVVTPVVQETTPVVQQTVPVVAPKKRVSKKIETKTNKVSPVKKSVVKKKPVAKKPVTKKQTTRIAKPKSAVAKRNVVKTEKIDKEGETEQLGEEGGKKNRYFKLIYNSKTSGRFSGNKPKQAANKALTSIVKSLDEENATFENKKFKFTIVECTRGSRHKEYHYVGERLKLKEPTLIKIKNANGDEKLIEYNYMNVVKKAKQEA